MSYSNINKTSYTATTSNIRLDEGLRKYMLHVYKHMGIALFITAIVAFFAAHSPGVLSIMNGPLGFVIALAPIFMAMYMGARITSMSVEGAHMSLAVFAGVMGLSLSTLFLVYTGESIARVFLISSCTFGAMTLYGYQTKKDLTSLGSFMIMGLIGIIIASLVNLFLMSSAIYFVTSLLGVGIFLGLTAYDTQRIKELYYQVGNEEMATKVAVLGALTLYMDFINLMIHLLRFFGERRDQ